jgi:hypothetical protein
MVRSFMVFLMALTGVFTSLGEAHAFNISIKGNLFYNDGVSTLTGADSITVKVFDSASNEIMGCTTMTGQTSYSISYDPAVAIAGANKTVTINFFLNGTLNRSIQGVNGTDGRTQFIDVAVSKAPATPQAAPATTIIIRGMLYYNNGTQKILPTDMAAVSALTRDNKKDGITIIQPTTTNPWSYTITIDPTKIMCADKSIVISFLLNGSVDRTVDGISAIGTPARPKVLDINYSKAVPTVTSETHPEAGAACESCGQSRRCERRPRLAIFRRGCR